MKVTVKKIITILLFTLLLPATVVAKPFLIITPNTSTLSIGKNGTAQATFTVTNNSGVAITGNITYTANITPSALFTSTINSSSTCGSSLTAGETCTLVTNITASARMGSGSLTPRVCYFNNCSTTNIPLTVQVTEVPTIISIEITPQSPTANIPGKQNITRTQLTATGHYSDGSTADITNSVNWSSSSNTYGTVTTSGSTRGQVTGVSVPAGTTTTNVTITAQDPTTSVQATKSVAVNLVVGSFYNQGYVYCLGTGSGNCAFLPSGNCPSGSPCVGEVIAETDNVDKSTGQQWYNGSYSTTNATSETNGQSNTTTIVNAQGTSANYAARTCQNYNSGDGNNTWYLPAKDELNVMYTKVSTLNTAGATLNTDISSPTSSIYWSSTEVDVFNAWAQFFSDGNPSYFDKISTDGVRCVRAF